MKKIILIFLIFHCSVLYSFAQLVHDFKVNDDTTNNIFRYHAAISTNTNGLTAIVWEEYIIGNIFAQLCDKNFGKINYNFRVNTNIDSCSNPGVIVTFRNKIGLVWQKAGVYDKVIFRLFNIDCLPLTSEIQIIDTLNGNGGHPKIGCDSSGRFIVVWQYGYIDYNIYFQILDSTGNKIGNNVKVNEDNDGFAADILVRRDGDFSVVWCGYNPLENIYLKMYDKNGNSLATSQRVNDTLTEYGGCSNPKIVGDSSGKFVVAFNEYLLSSNWNYVKYQRYNKNGTKIGNNKVINSPSKSY